MKYVISVLALLFTAAVFPPSASGAPSDWTTQMKVNDTIYISRQLLEPGEYVLKLVRLPGGGKIVQVFHSEDNELHATILAIPSYRFAPSDSVELTFWETSSGEPRALRTWFHPGEMYGLEFQSPD